MYLKIRFDGMTGLKITDILTSTPVPLLCSVCAKRKSEVEACKVHTPALWAKITETVLCPSQQRSKFYCKQRLDSTLNDGVTQQMCIPSMTQDAGLASHVP
jgi:hypothetical protein